MSAHDLSRSAGKLVDELKIRARLRLRALVAGDPEVVERVQALAATRRWALPVEWRLHHALNIVAVECGFRHWDHARRILGGTARQGDDFGELWHEDTSMVLLNHWFARYEDAKQLLTNERRRFYLFPYRRQFVVGDENYVKHLKLPAQSELWSAANFDLAAAYGSPVWRELCTARLAARKPKSTEPAVVARH